MTIRIYHLTLLCALLVVMLTTTSNTALANSSDLEEAQRNQRIIDQRYFHAFNVFEYAALNPDVNTACLRYSKSTGRAYPDYNCIKKHFLERGRYEGRPTREEFDPAAYRFMNDDLAGYDNPGLYEHFNKFGWKESHRIAAISHPVYSNYWYRTLNPDYVNYRDEDNEIVGPDAHFRVYGIGEGRITSDRFSVGAYRHYNPDLANFNPDLGVNEAAARITQNYKLMLHYLKYGQYEGRRAF